MAKIENYSNDTDITNNDRLFGTSVNGNDSETANFKVGELKTFINTGNATTSDVATAKAEAIAAAAADTDTDIDAATSSITTAYQAYADQAETDAIAAAATYTNTKVGQNLTLIQSNDTDIATNTANIATNTSNIANVSADAVTNAAAITSTNTVVSANTSNISSLNSNVNTNTSNISTNTSNISANTSSISTNTSNISTNTTNISTNTTNISLIAHHTIAARAVATSITNTSDPFVIDFASTGSDAGSNTLVYNAINEHLGVAPDSGTITNNKNAAINVKIDITALTTTQSATTIEYGIEKDSGSGFSNIKTFVRDKSTGNTSTDHVDSFFIYLNLAQDEIIRFTFKASQTSATLNAGSWFEITAI
jgi:hypothetical protein